MAKKGFYIFCDESVKEDRHYSNFYGGSMVAKADLPRVNQMLSNVVGRLSMEDSELKWSNINTFRVDAYCQVLDVFFDAVEKGLIKVRVMFTDNRHEPTAISSSQKKIEYHLLYYQFIKHAFGFSQLESDYEIHLEMFFDMLPDTKEKNKKFKDFIFGL